MAQSQPPNSRLTTDHWSRWEWLVLTLILCLAAAVRLWRLDSIPPGFTHDEAGHGHDAVAILNGARPIYQTVGYGREPLYDYLVAGLMALFGPTGSMLRLSALPLGLLTLLATFAWTRLAFDRPTALGATALQAASFWSLSTSRQALRSGLLSALFALAIYFYWQAIGDGRKKSILAVPRPYETALCALFIGATLYTYIPARVLWVVFPVFLAYLLFFQRASFRRAWLPTLVAVLVGLLLAAPLFAYLRAHPQAEQRLAMLDEPLQALRTGDFSVILGRAWGCVAGFFVPGRGDDFLAYTIPGRPFFDPLTGALFVAGVILCLAHWRKPACAFSLLWFVVGISPSLITGASASTTRSIAALPVAYTFPALAVVTGARWVAARWTAARWGRRAAWAIGVGFVGLIVATGAIAARDYFVTWGESPSVRAAYMQPLIEIGGYLEQAPPGESVGISTYLPHAPHDPYVFDMILSQRDRSASLRQDLSLRWFDARRAIVFPPEASASLIAPAGAPLDPYFAVLPGLALRERISLRDDDLDPFFDVYDWQPQVAVAALRERALPGSAVWANFADALHLIGYDLRTPEVAPGEMVELVTLWQVVDPQPLRPRNLANAEEDQVVFTHALDEAGSVVGQEDRLDAPAWDWQAGDVIAQIHRFTLLPGLAESEVTLEVGVYRRSDETRLPVLVNGSVVGDSVLLQSLKVKGR